MFRAMWSNELNEISNIWVEENKSNLFSKLFSRISKVTSERNIIIHSKWFPPIDHPDFSKDTGFVNGIKTKANKDGDATIYPKYSEIEFRNFITECNTLEQAIFFINYCVDSKRYNFSDFFEFEKKKLLILCKNCDKEGKISGRK